MQDLEGRLQHLPIDLFVTRCLRLVQQYLEGMIVRGWILSARPPAGLLLTSNTIDIFSDQMLVMSFSCCNDDKSDPAQ